MSKPNRTIANLTIASLFLCLALTNLAPAQSIRGCRSEVTGTGHSNRSRVAPHVAPSRGQGSRTLASQPTSSSRSMKHRFSNDSRHVLSSSRGMNLAGSASTSLLNPNAAGGPSVPDTTMTRNSLASTKRETRGSTANLEHRTTATRRSADGESRTLAATSADANEVPSEQRDRRNRVMTFVRDQVMPRLADYAQHAGERFPTAAPAEVVTSMDSDYPAEAASADVGETDVEQLDLPQVPVGSPLTLTLKLPQVEGVILLKAGPLVIRLDPETWNTVGTSLTLPAFELMRRRGRGAVFIESGRTINRQLPVAARAYAKVNADRRGHFPTRWKVTRKTQPSHELQRT